MSVSVVVSVPAYPNVPQLPGVPQLVRALAGTPGAVTQAPNASSLTAPSMPTALQQAVTSAPVWGIFDDGNNLVIDPDSVMTFGYRSEYRLANYPIQQGQFAAYNKVKVPFENVVRLVKGGSLSDRTTFENDCDDVTSSLELYTIVTPERSYVGVNVLRFEIERREAQDANYTQVEMFFQEIRQVTPQYSSTSTATNLANASNPAAVPTQNLGIVQTVNTAPAVAQLTSDYLNGTVPDYQAMLLPNTLSQVTSTNFARIPDALVP